MKENRRLRNVSIGLTIANASLQGFDVCIHDDIKTTYEGAKEFLKLKKEKK